MNFYIIPGLKEKEAISSKMSESSQIKLAIDIINTVCMYYDLTYEQISRKDRHRDIVTACQIACHIMKIKVPKLQLRTIASLFGNRYEGKKGPDHSAILHNRQQAQDLIDTEEQFKDDVDALLKMI